MRLRRSWQDTELAGIEAYLRREIEEKEIPGCSFAIGLDGRLAGAAGIGLRRAGSGGRVTPRTLFRIGSVAKVMTAFAVLQQVEAQRVCLSENLAAWIPEIRRARRTSEESLTVRHLLTHSSGLADFYPGRGDLEAWAQSLGHIPALAPPGQFWNYSNSNYSLAGLVLQRASGVPYERYLQQAVWRPAGLHRTTVLASEAIADGDFAVGHDGPQGIGFNTREAAALAPAGLVYSTATELVAWVHLLMAGGGGLLSPGLVQGIVTPQVPRGTMPSSFYTFGLYLDDWREVQAPQRRLKVLHHDGSLRGHRACLYWVPSRRVVLALLVNSRAYPRRSALHALRRLAGIEPAPKPAGSCDPQTYWRYTGRYRIADHRGLNWLGEVSRSGESLLLRHLDGEVPGGSAAQSHLKPQFLNTFIYAESSGTHLGQHRTVTFLGDSGGRARWLRNRYHVGHRLSERRG